jgi:hypothetical protein
MKYAKRPRINNERKLRGGSIEACLSTTYNFDTKYPGIKLTVTAPCYTTEGSCLHYFQNRQKLHLSVCKVIDGPVCSIRWTYDSRRGKGAERR